MSDSVPDTPRLMAYTDADGPSNTANLEAAIGKVFFYGNETPSWMTMKQKHSSSLIY